MLSLWRGLLTLGVFGLYTCNGQVKLLFNDTVANRYLDITKHNTIYGACQGAEGTIQTVKYTDNSETCRDPESRTGTSAQVLANDMFSISDIKYQTYVIKCVADKGSTCASVFMYNISLLNIVTGKDETKFTCSIDFTEYGSNQQSSADALPLEVGYTLDGNLQQSHKYNYTDLRNSTNGKAYSKSFVISTPTNVSYGGDYKCVYCLGAHKGCPSGKRLESNHTVTLNQTLITKVLTDPNKEQYTDDETVTITCEVFGSNPSITWYFNGQPYTPSNITLNLSSSTLANQSFVIDKLDSTIHRGDYKCVGADSSGSDVTVMTTLRVRNKLAPVWPFVGIVVQVIVLAICIAIGEKLRKKRLADKHRRKQVENQAGTSAVST